MDLLQCYLLLAIKWKQNQSFLIDVTGNVEEGKRTSRLQIEQKELKNICLHFVVMRDIVLQNAVNHKHHLSSRTIKEVHQC